MKVLAFASYPFEAAGTRYRLQQFAGPLAERGITLTIKPFLDSRGFNSLYQRRALASTGFGLLIAVARRMVDVYATRKADVVLIQREAMIFGPPLIEWLAARVFNRPLLLEIGRAHV